MSMLPEMLGAEATPHTIEFKGKRYSFKPITVGLLEEMETTHFEQSKKRLKDMRDVLDKDTFVKKGLELYDDYDAGEFGFFSARGQKWARSPAGAMLIMKLALGVGDEELLPLVLSRGQELMQLMQLVLKEAGLSGGPAKPPGEGAAEEPFRPGGGHPGPAA